jgi:phosphoribosyl 1,2-cyclic phosphodiesterase
MKLRFWGVRGSIPSPGPNTIRYGGNTTCIEIRTDGGQLIIIDAGTGIHSLAQSLLQEMPVEANIFITHSHWDHIHGLPFFVPIFIPGNTIKIHGAFDPVSGQGIEQIMAVQMQYSFFPIREAELRARIEYRTLMPGEQIQIGDATITPLLLNHPVVDYGYRIDCNGKSIFFTGDHEPHSNIYAPEDDGYAEYEALLEEKRREIHTALAGIDVLIADASYTIEEYPAKKGWGHGTFDSCMNLAASVGAKTLFCTHHEPTRSDDALERAFTQALERWPQHPSDIRLAKEGPVFDID